MSTYPAPPRDNDVPTVVLSTPVEIWEEIINGVLFDPIIFSVDPFYPGCNLHTALAEWHDAQRLRKQEAQQGILRLVSRSWKALVDRSSWQGFEARRSVSAAKHPTGLVLARRLNMQLTCTSCDTLWQNGHDLCDMCDRNDNIHTAHDLFDLNGPMKVEILYYPLVMRNDHSAGRNQKCFYQYTPKLRALFISPDRVSTPDAVAMFSNLTVLGIRVTYWWDDLEDLVLPSITVFQLRVDSNAHCEFLMRWAMPRLAHLDIGSKSDHDVMEDIDPFLALNGLDLISLRIRNSTYDVVLSDNIWDLLPHLQYIRLSTLSRLFRGPPRGHPLRTFAILDDVGEFLSTLRKEIWELIGDSERIGDWECFTTIADCHDWSDIGDVNSGDEDDIRHYICIIVNCTRCVCRLHHKCVDLGLRYEDCKGRTLDEFVAHKS